MSSSFCLLRLLLLLGRNLRCSGKQCISSSFSYLRKNMEKKKYKKLHMSARASVRARFVAAAINGALHSGSVPLICTRLPPLAKVVGSSHLPQPPLNAQDNTFFTIHIFSLQSVPLVSFPSLSLTRLAFHIFSLATSFLRLPHGGEKCSATLTRLPETKHIYGS